MTLRDMIIASALALSACGQPQPSQAWLNANRILAQAEIRRVNAAAALAKMDEKGPDGMTDSERRLVRMYKNYGGRAMKICNFVVGPITNPAYGDCLDALDR